MVKKRLTLDLGCGYDKYKPETNDRVVGIDLLNSPEVDIVGDLEKPLPFKDNSFEEIYSNNTFEHIDKAKELIEECWRVVKPDSEIIVRVPHFTFEGMYTDLTHETFFSSRSFDFYIPGTLLEDISKYNKKIRFKCKQKKIIFNFPYRFLEIIVNFSDRTRLIYEYFFCFIFPAREILFVLKPIK